MKLFSFASRTVEMLAWAGLLAVLGGVSAGHAEPSERQLEHRPRPTTLQSGKPGLIGDAYRFSVGEWDKGNLFLIAPGSNADVPPGEIWQATAEVGGESGPGKGARTFLLHEPWGFFSVFVEGWGATPAAVSFLFLDKVPVRLTDDRLDAVNKEGAEVVLHDGRRFEVDEADRAIAASLKVPIGAWVVAEDEILIKGTDNGKGPVLDVKILH